jgi:hypothetical protein
VDGVASVGDLALVVAVDDGGAGVDEGLLEDGEQLGRPDLGLEECDSHDGLPRFRVGAWGYWMPSRSLSRPSTRAFSTSVVLALGHQSLDVGLGQLRRAGLLASPAVCATLEPLAVLHGEVGLGLDEVSSAAVMAAVVDLSVVTDLERVEVEELVGVRRVREDPLAAALTSDRRMRSLAFASAAVSVSRLRLFGGVLGFLAVELGLECGAGRPRLPWRASRALPLGLHGVERLLARVAESLLAVVGGGLRCGGRSPRSRCRQTSGRQSLPSWWCSRLPLATW